MTKGDRVRFKLNHDAGDFIVIKDYPELDRVQIAGFVCVNHPTDRNLYEQARHVGTIDKVELEIVTEGS